MRSQVELELNFVRGDQFDEEGASFELIYLLTMPGIDFSVDNITPPLSISG
jgi:hypothetical protein